jgi:hypothetical protein
MTSDFRNLLNPTGAPGIHPGSFIPRPGEPGSYAIREDHSFNLSALQQHHHRDTKPAAIRESDFASRMQSLLSGEVALANHLDVGGSSALVMSSSSSGGLNVPNGVVEAQQDSSSRAPSRYEAQKRRDWNTFGQYLRNHRPPLALARCTGVHVLEFVRYLDQFGKTKVHNPSCPFFGLPHPPHPCTCPLRQAWGSLDALIGRLRAAFEENGGKPESNPFGARQVRLYLREVREMQAKARGIAYEKKKRKRMPPTSEAGGPSASNEITMTNGNPHPLPGQQPQ